MSLNDLLRTKRLRPHEPTTSEMKHLLDSALRDLRHVRQAADTDWRFIAAYSAALSLATIPLAASGFRATGAGHHVTIIAALPAILGPDVQELEAYLQECRSLRNKAMYDQPYLVTAENVRELVQAVDELQQRVLAWLADEHPELVPQKRAGTETDACRRPGNDEDTVSNDGNGTSEP